MSDEQAAPREAAGSQWLELSTRAEAETVEAIAEIFQRWGQGVAIEEPVVAGPDETYHIDYTQPVKITTYLPLDSAAEEHRQRIEEALHWLGRLRPIEPLTVRQLAASDWESAWKRYFYVRHVGRRLVIVPSWRRYQPKPGEVVLDLDPGMAFGTGVHPTTRLCLQLLERHLRPGATVSGPALMALADFAMYVLLLSRIGPVELAVTTSFNINFMRKPKGDVVAEARMLKLGRSLAVGAVELFAEGSPELVAHATVTYSIPPDRKA